MTDLLASVDDLVARLDWELDEAELRIATAAIEDLSDDARHYGVATWTTGTVPRSVRTIILRAAVRYMRNPDGYIQSRAGDEIVGWAPRNTAGAAEFTPEEKAEIKDMARRGSPMRVVGIYSYMRPGDEQFSSNMVPVHYHGKGFRFP